MENQEAVKRILDVVKEVLHEKQNQVLFEILNEVQNVRQVESEQSAKNAEYHSKQLEEFLSMFKSNK